MRMMPIASGSSGNCIYIGSDDTHILIDAGISRKKIEEGLNSIDVSLKVRTFIRSLLSCLSYSVAAVTKCAR